MKYLATFLFFCVLVFVGARIVKENKVTKNKQDKVQLQNEQNEGKAGNTYTVVTAGDISCNSTSKRQNECKDALTAKLVSRINPDVVLTLGDQQYPSGSINDFKNYFDKTWGAFKDKIHPTPGNHEYNQPYASGYFEYFGGNTDEGNQGWYSFDLGSWHIVSLNSNCWAVGGCGKDSPQGKWLEEDLSKPNLVCVLAFWHHPLMSSGSIHGGTNVVNDLWQMLGFRTADIVLNGHEHNYERFKQANANQIEDGRGIREFVVGTGGRSLYPFGIPHTLSEKRISKSFGVLKLMLKPDNYEWEFISIDNQVLDFGNTKCNRFQ